MNDQQKLPALIEQERDAILSCWRRQVRQLPSAQHLDLPTLTDHIPNFLEELTAALRCTPSQSIPEALCEGSPPAHGLQRFEKAFDIEEVVAEYSILRGCIYDVADENGLPIPGQPFHIINRVFDHAIALAVRAYATQRALDTQRRREEYLAFVAHDLRTPLNAISLAGKVLELELPAQGASAETTQMLKVLHRNVRQLEGLVGKVLEENLALQTEIGIRLERREFDLWSLVEGLIYDLHPVAGTASTKLINNVPNDLVIYADASLVRRIFQNLIANAIKFTPRGRVIIGARELVEERTVECWVSDNGAGIPEEFIDKIFEMGETDPENKTGMGLGLAIVKTFTEAHGGTVAVESKPGIGSTFRFTLPVKNNAHYS